ncbi:cysteine hydrolase family protein [Paenibacillus sp.]|jgi:nicotinamidase-related amidase|uniref:cysteine hydrolase family protein n=1 Tax=Paenibacillus sp. TaxID=58172 RepID=UPI00282E84D2|nr:cysteine hydrolase family protein [Paenibacillus sp.]MDR0271481.1 cysteine hydrolase [Paenibacillus sp.]
MSKQALLVIDIQVGMFSESDPVYDGAALLGRINVLLHNARTSGIPVIYVQHNEGPGEQLETETVAWEIHPSIAPEPEDTIIQKFMPDSFHETSLQEVLSSRGIENLVIAGIQTDCCVNATSRRAGELGYDITVVEDAHSTWGQGEKTAAEIIAEHNEQFQKFAEIKKTQDITFS